MRTDAICYLRLGRGVVPGLGDVSESYAYPVLADPPGCSVGTFHILAYVVRITVLGKGHIYLAVPGSTACLLAGAQALNPTYPPITITGGSGAFAGAPAPER
ncbi:MAG: hypothetical protein H0U03_12350 [Actinobacteria bacterium]|nr:hypothetical protein [Actinomycetota bacterium]